MTNAEVRALVKLMSTDSPRACHVKGFSPITEVFSPLCFLPIAGTTVYRWAGRMSYADYIECLTSDCVFGDNCVCPKTLGFGRELR